MMREKNLHTVCEAKCPNIHECWGARRTATFMILVQYVQEHVVSVQLKLDYLMN